MAIQTTVNDSNVYEFLGTLEDPQQLVDSKQLITIMQGVSGELPKMWGSSIIGFGSYHYKSERSRQEGDWMKIGFSPRKGKISLYLTGDAEKLTSSVDSLGKFQTGKGCVYIKRLSDVNLESLISLIKIAYKQSP